jgi:chaperone required for assembly of F1-ATPase
LKRFYKTAATGTVDGADGHAILLDGRPVRTPERRIVAVPGRALADAIAGEWNAQGDEIDMATMPLMRLGASALDRVAPRRADFVDQLARFGDTDLVCYRAPAPSDLVDRQSAAWQPLVDWVLQQFDAPLDVTTDIAPLTQPENASAALRAAIEAHDDFELAALGLAVQACGSLVIGLALSHGRLEAPAAGDASQLDELYQAELWGEEADAAARRASLRDDIACAAAFFALHREAGASPLA